MIRDFPRAFRPANAEPQPRKIIRAQMLLDGLQSVMATTATARPQANLASGKSASSTATNSSDCGWSW